MYVHGSEDEPDEERAEGVVEVDCRSRGSRRCTRSGGQDCAGRRHPSRDYKPTTGMRQRSSFVRLASSRG